jgi:hypothetical protein
MPLTLVQDDESAQKVVAWRLLVSDEWVWDGQKFVHTKDMWTGMCKGLLRAVYGT